MTLVRKAKSDSADQGGAVARLLGLAGFHDFVQRLAVKRNALSVISEYHGVVINFPNARSRN
jgi:hypothetical protein